MHYVESVKNDFLFKHTGDVIRNRSNGTCDASFAIADSFYPIEHRNSPIVYSECLNSIRFSDENPRKLFISICSCYFKNDLLLRELKLMIFVRYLNNSHTEKSNVRIDRFVWR